MKTTKNKNGIHPKSYVSIIAAVYPPASKNSLETYSKEEASKRGNRKVASILYYVNYSDFVNVLRWRLHRLKLMAAEEQTATDDSYVCPNCSEKYKALEVDKLIR